MPEVVLLIIAALLSGLVGWFAAYHKYGFEIKAYIKKKEIDEAYDRSKKERLKLDFELKDLGEIIKDLLSYHSTVERDLLELIKNLHETASQEQAPFEQVPERIESMSSLELYVSFLGRFVKLRRATPRAAVLAERADDEQEKARSQALSVNLNRLARLIAILDEMDEDNPRFDEIKYHLTKGSRHIDRSDPQADLISDFIKERDLRDDHRDVDSDDVYIFFTINLLDAEKSLVESRIHSIDEELDRYARLKYTEVELLRVRK